MDQSYSITHRQKQLQQLPSYKNLPHLDQEQGYLSFHLFALGMTLCLSKVLGAKETLH